MKIELFHDYLIRNAQENPDDMAITAVDNAYTFDQLNRAANKFANGLIKRGVKCGDCIMSAMPRDSRHFVAMFGILKAGAVMIPVDVSYPEGRIESMRQDSGAVMMVGTSEGPNDVLFEDIFEGGTEDEPPRPAIDGNAPCLVLYTSGSTGNPKGVMLKHRGFIANSLPVKENLHSYLTSQYCKTIYDITTTTFVAWYFGYALFLSNRCHFIFADLESSRGPMIIAKQMVENNVVFSGGTPSRILEYLKVPAFKEMIKICKILAVGGEPIPDGFPEAVHEVAPECHIVNGYGQTEACGVCMAGEITNVNAPLFPFHEWKFLIVDEKNEEVPVGDKGELLLGGDNLMVGYLNQPEEMEKKTIIKDGVRYFRTGDLALRMENGGTRIVGRIDHMIKLRGLRIEPGEIETVIQKFNGIKIEKAVVKVNNIHGTDHLVAYYTGDGMADEMALRRHLRYDLPAYMVPDYFMFMKEFPLNDNGKIDRKNLPEIVVDSLEIVPPANDIERSLLGICTEIAGYEEFGVTVPLEEIGFTSLTYIELATKVIDAVGVELKLSDLMAGGTTIRTLAKAISDADMLKKEKKELKDRYPLAPQQYQFMSVHEASDMYRKFTFIDKWSDALAIRKAFVNIINSFPYLYTTFRKEDDEWYQIPYTGDLIKEEDVPIIDGEPSESVMDEFLKPYDISTAKRLFDISIYKGQKVIVLLHSHHILMDHVFVEKLISYISQALRKPNFRPAEQADYFDYVSEKAVQKAPVEGKELHRVLETKTVVGSIDVPSMRKNVEKFKLQPAEYLFGLLGQAYLDVTGKDEAVIRNLFGGRNEARYFNTAGYFPYSMPITVKKDKDIFTHVKEDMVEALKNSSPKDDYSYNAIVNHDFAWPNIVFNCMDNILQTEDFELLSLQARDIVPSEESKLAAAHIAFICIVLPHGGGVVHVIFDPSTIDEEKAEAILERANEISKSL